MRSESVPIAERKRNFIVAIIAPNAGEIRMIKRAAFLALLLILTIGGICEARESKFSSGRIRPNESIAGKASWYSSKDACGKQTNNHPGCPTASGKSIYKLENEGALFAAVPPRTHKIGTRLKVTNQRTGRSVIVTVLDTGGFRKYRRSIDLGKNAFARIASLEDGVINVTIEKI